MSYSMGQGPASRRAYQRVLAILAAAMILGPLLFLGLSVGLHASGQFSALLLEFSERQLLAVTAGLVTAGHLFGRALFRIRMRNITGNIGLSQKLALHRSAVIMRAAVMEGTVLLTSVAFLLTGFYSLAIIALAGIAGMALYFPTADRIGQELGLSDEENRAFDEPGQAL